MSERLIVRRRRGSRRRRGQGMTEYIVLVGLIAIILIGTVRIFSNSLGNAFNSATSRIDKDVTAQIQAAPTNGGH